jgi:hypothetical protein
MSRGERTFAPTVGRTMSAFEIVIFAVALIAAALSMTRYFWPGRALADMGRMGATWFENPAERELSELPDDDAEDAPLPRRQLRARY